MMRLPADCLRTEIVLPVSKASYFNTKRAPRPQLCAYDMVYHPPDYNPYAARSDRQDSRIIRKNIWNQERNKPIASTTNSQYGRPYWKMKDPTAKQHVKAHEDFARPNMRMYDVFSWSTVIGIGKTTICDDKAAGRVS